MTQANGAYRSITSTDEFKELERLRSLARHNEASALANARREATETERAKWQGVVEDNRATIAEQAALIAELLAKIDEGK
jgi:hypothetical protein